MDTAPPPPPLPSPTAQPSDFSLLLDQVQSAFSPHISANSNRPAPSLPHILQAMEARAAQTLAATRSVLSSHHPHFSAGLHCAQELSASVHSLHADLAKITSGLSEEDASLGNVNEQLKESKRESVQQVKQLRGKVEGLRSVVQAQEQIAAFDAAFLASKVLTAARLLLDFDQKISALKTQLQPSPASALDNSLLLRALRAQCARDKARLLAKLSTLWEACVSIQDGQIQVSAEVFGTQADGSSVAVPMGDVAMALSAAGGLRLRLEQRFSQRLWNTLCLPILQDPSCSVLKRTSGPGGRISILQIVPTKDSDISPMEALEQAIEKILVVLRFVEHYVVEGRKEWMALLQQEVWAADGRMGDQALEMLKQSVAEEGEGAAFEKALSQAKEFEEELVDMGIVSSQQRRLAPFIDDIHVHVQKERTAAILAATRKDIQQEWLSSVYIRGFSDETKENKGGQNGAKDDEIDVSSLNDGLGEFKISPMRVSECAKRLVNTLLTPSCETSVCADLVTLFMTLVPYVHADAISSSPRASVIFHNDCLFLSHVLLRHHSQLIHVVPALRKLGDSTFNKAMAAQLREIDLGMGRPQSGFDVDETLKRVGEAIEKGLRPCAVVKEWQGVLGEGLRKTASEALVGRALGLVVKGVVDGRPLASFSSKEMICLRVMLKETLEKTRRLSGMEVQVESKVKLEQICATLDETTTLHIMRDKVTDGKLAALDAKEVDGLCTFLFASEVNAPA